MRRAPLLSALLAGDARASTFERGRPSEELPGSEDSFLDRAVLEEMSDQPGASGARLIQQNPLAFAYRLETARRAERSLDVQYYIWHADYTGRMLAAELLLAAERGVRVRILLDGLEMRDRQHVLAIADSHPRLEVRLFNPFVGSPLGMLGELLLRGGRLNHRMHNKAWIADNRVALLGGRNVGDEYFGAAEGSNFSDTGVLLAGAAVAQVSREFDRYWNSAAVIPVSLLHDRAPDAAQLQRLLQESLVYETRAGEAPFAVALRDPVQLARRLAARPPPAKVHAVQVVADDPEKIGSGARGTRASRVLDAVLMRARQAERELLVVSPYFVPGAEVTAILLDLAKRGVRVAVLTNSLAATDVAGVHAGYARYRRTLLAAGVELYEMKRTLTEESHRRRLSLTGSSRASLHTKAVTVDGRWVFVGSLNVDPRSININTEMGALLESEEMAAQMVAQFAHTTAPEMSYAVRLVDQRLRWTDRADGRERVFDNEPEAGWGRRAAALLLRLLPIESQL